MKARRQVRGTALSGQKLLTHASAAPAAIIAGVAADALFGDPRRGHPVAAFGRAATVTLAVRWQSSSVAETLLGIPGVTQVDTRTVQATGTAPELFRQFGVWMRVASALTNQAPYC